MTRIAFIGVGSMGAAIIPHLLGAGFQVSAWSRRSEAVEALPGVTPLARAHDAFLGHDVVMTMLSDDAAVREVIIDSGALRAAHGRVVHIVMSTLSTRFVSEIQAAHRDAGVGYVAAPVFGVPAVAARAELNVLLAGADADVQTAMPVLAVISKQIWPLGQEPVRANIAKIAGNMMITLAIEAMAEASALVEGHGLPAADFFDVVTQTMFACPSYQRYARNIATQSYAPGFKLALGLKDVNLALDAAAEAGAAVPSAKIVQNSMQQAMQDGNAAKDWSILAEAARQRPVDA